MKIQHMIKSLVIRINYKLLTVGPTGVGKSLFSNRIYQLDAKKYQHIDGDILDLDFDIVSRLSYDRSQYTRSKIFQCLYHGKIPILSIGGGVLVGNMDKSINFFDELIDLFKTKKVDIILCLPSLNTNVQYIEMTTICDEIGKNYDYFTTSMPILEKIYNDKVLIQKSIEYRIQNYLWKLPKNKLLQDFTTELFKKSKANVSIVQNIIKTLI